MTFLLFHRGCRFDALVEYRSVDSGGNAATIATYLIFNGREYVDMSLHKIISQDLYFIRRIDRKKREGKKSNVLRITEES